jgi:hypothetical protein
MVRVKLTLRVRLVLFVLAAYLAVMLGLIVYRFVVVIGSR